MPMLCLGYFRREFPANNENCLAQCFFISSPLTSLGLLPLNRKVLPALHIPATDSSVSQVE